MTFKICFVNKVNTILVAKFVPEGVVGIVAGADSIDVVALHKTDIPEHIFFGNYSSAFCAPLVAIDTLENYSLAVQTHNAVF